ncbi:MAG TPA: xanthine dehydrogenase accessory protein XdhC, partial [Lautropia sp.]|nr:xanthine dehydrogenase accessory protein XdhC [Lautropia sp.]
MTDWIETLLECRRLMEDAVLVSVAAARGSVPREPGTRMVVTPSRQHGTIGGGHLELKAIGLARELLAGGNVGALQRFPLGAALGQCCGGVVDLMMEKVPPSGAAVQWLDEIAGCRLRGEPCVLVSAAGHPDAPGTLVVTQDGCVGSLGNARDAAARAVAGELLASGDVARLVSFDGVAPFFLFDPVRQPSLDIVLFGAGHVGQALAKIFSDLPCRVAWVDERADLFPARVAANIRIEVSEAPLAEVDAARAGACFLVMTHSHALDEALAEAILRRADFRYFGLIGSLSKRRRFE